jgi:formylmethanofuran dehydrogenase subunit C
MTALTFTLKQPLNHALDCSRLTSNILEGKTLAQINNLILNENQKVIDFFEVSGSDALNITFKSTDKHLINVGQNMRKGIITIEGDRGDFLGVKMQGGTIICKGNAGDRVGDKMRRGIVLIEGNVGEYCAASMMAGTIGVLGTTGDYLGYGMKRGTLLLAKPPANQVTWEDCGSHSLPFLKLLFKSFALFDSQFSKLTSTRVQRWMGDISGIGKAEILLLKS